MSSEIMNHDLLNSLHDAELVGIAYNSGHTIRLDFARDEGSNVSVTLLNVTKFLANNLLDGNIVLDVYSTKYKMISSECVENIVSRAFAEDFITKTEELAQAAKLRLDKLLSQINKGELQLFVVEPSYGAEVVAICSNVCAECTECTR